MNSVTFGIILTSLMVYVSSSDYIILSENNVSVSIPYNFSFKLNQFLLMSITLKNIPPSVTTIHLLYTTKVNFYVKDSAVKKIKIDGEIKNGEVKIMFLRHLEKDYNVFVDVQLETKDGILCKKLRIAEGRYGDNSHTYFEQGKYIYWNTNWQYNDKFHCIAPNLCEIVVDFKKQCAENFFCYYSNAAKYICKLKNESQKIKHYTLYQTYGNDVSSVELPFREDYTCLEAVEACYKIHKTPKKWHEARRVCTQEGTTLFYPENSDEVTAVLDFWKSNSSASYMYVGLTDLAKEGQFRTVDNKPIAEVYHKWRVTQPDNFNGEHCVHIDKNGEYNDISCNIQYTFICKKSLLTPERNIQHNSSSLIGAPLNTSAVYTKLIIELESFDNNTSLNVVPLKFFRNYTLWSKKIILPANYFVKNNTVTILNYSETKEVPFSCQESKYKQSFTALITKENKIITFNETQKNHRKFKMSDNGSVLCCLYYDYKSTNDGELQITRFVVNKNLLTYQYVNPGGNESQLLARSYNYSWVLYLSATLIGVSVLILTLYFILKRGWFKKSQPNVETVEMDNQTDQNEVLYANLEFVNIANPPHQTRNEVQSNYAEIIGVLHPH